MLNFNTLLTFVFQCFKNVSLFQKCGVSELCFRRSQMMAYSHKFGAQKAKARGNDTTKGRSIEMF